MILLWSGLFKRFIHLFYSYGCFVCMYLHNVCAVQWQPEEGIVCLELDFRHFWVSLWVLKTESWSLAKTTRALKLCSISQALVSELLRVNPKPMKVRIPYLYSYYSWVQKPGEFLLYACRGLCKLWEGGCLSSPWSQTKKM